MQISSELQSLINQYNDKIRKLENIQNLNESLLDCNHNLLLRLIKLCKISGVPLDPETKSLVSEVRQKLHLINEACNQPRGNTNKIHRKGDSTILKIDYSCRWKLFFIRYLNPKALWVEAIQLRR